MGPPRGFREQGNKGIFFRGTREQRSKNVGTGAQRQFWGTGNIGNDDFDFGQQENKVIQPEHVQTNKMTRAHGENADQPGHLRSLIRVFAVRSVGSQGTKLSSCGQRRL